MGFLWWKYIIGCIERISGWKGCARAPVLFHLRCVEASIVTLPWCRRVLLLLVHNPSSPLHIGYNAPVLVFVLYGRLVIGKCQFSVLNDGVAEGSKSPGLKPKIRQMITGQIYHAPVRSG